MLKTYMCLNVYVYVYANVYAYVYLYVYVYVSIDMCMRMFMHTCNFAWMSLCACAARERVRGRGPKRERALLHARVQTTKYAPLHGALGLPSSLAGRPPPAAARPLAAAPIFGHGWLIKTRQTESSKFVRLGVVLGGVRTSSSLGVMVHAHKTPCEPILRWR